MKAKENLLRFYRHQKIEVMPLVGEGEALVYPVNGFEERPPYDRGGTDWFGCAWEYMDAAGAPAVAEALASGTCLSIHSVEPDLEEVFLELTGREF